MLKIAIRDPPPGAGAASPRTAGPARAPCLPRPSALLRQRGAVQQLFEALPVLGAVEAAVETDRAEVGVQLPRLLDQRHGVVHVGTFPHDLIVSHRVVSLSALLERFEQTDRHIPGNRLADREGVRRCGGKAQSCATSA